MIEFRMPSLGADMEAGTLVQVLVRPGDAVARGDIVAVVETQKGAIEIENFDAGVLDRWLVQPGAKVPVGTPLALIRGESEPPAAAFVPAPPPAPKPAAPPPPAVRPVEPSEKIRASPAARRLAAERGLDLSRLSGTGLDGAIQLADVEAAVRPAGVDLSQMRVAIAAAMSRSKREIPHYYVSETVDVQAASDWVDHCNAERPPDKRILLGALFVKAVAVAAKAYPEFNGAYAEGSFRSSPAVHVGVAIAIRGGGLVAPAVHHTTDLPLDLLMERMRDLVGRVRAGRLRSSEISDPTITVSSLGERGAEALFGVIYPPQVAIIGFGKVATRPWISEGAVVPRALVTLSLAADHRVSDGHRGALFLAEIARLLQRPEDL